MIAIFRQYVAARHRFITAIYVAAFASVLISQNANATYVAAMFNENIFVIGTDSRRLSSDGRIVSDEACKIILLNDSSAFVLMGAETWTPNNAVVPRMNFYDIARTTGAPASLTLNAAARANFGVIESGGFPLAIGWASLSSLIRLWEAGRWRRHILRTCACG